MSIANPVIIYPGVGPEIRTNSISTSVSGTTQAHTTAIKYEYALLPEGSTLTPVYSTMTSVGVSYVATEDSFVTEVPWTIDTRAVPGFVQGTVLYLKIYAEDEDLSEISIPSDYVIHFVAYDQVLQTAPTPTGITASRSNTAITVEVAELPPGTFAGTFVGFNFYVSLEVGGGQSGYQRVNTDYVKDPSRTASTVVTSSTETSTADGVTVETTVTSVAESPMYSFVLDKPTLQNLVAEGKLPNIRYSDATPFYFVATSVIFDDSSDTEIESLYSPELKTKFLSFVPEFKELPPRNREDILLSMAERLMTLNRGANVISGSVYRDILDPVSEEMANAYVVQDFISRSQSMDGLLQLDDENGDGISDPPSTSVAKKRLQVALGVTNDIVLQNIIDSAFSKLAANFNISRLPPTYATGKVVFYTNTVPPEGLFVNNSAVLLARSSSGESIRFLVQGSKYLYFSEKDRYYNATRRRYEVTCDVIASVTGSSSNVATGTITTISNGADARWKVTNPVPMTGGTFNESNNSLANRTKLAISGLDTGTEGGYLLKTIGVPGVKFAKVVTSGDSLMHRDVDPSTGRHLGGKVDIYVQGDRVSQWQDTFAFSYSGPTGNNSGEKFFVEDAESFLLRTDAPAVTVATPIFEVLRVTNLTRGASYDVSGAVAGLGDGDSIMLAQNATNLEIGMATLDVIEVDYRYRGYNSYVLSHQPVEEILSVTGDIDGVLPPENYKLMKLEDPMYTGNSTISSDGVEILYFRGLPTSSVQTVANEAHVLLVDRPALLTKKGVDTDTIIVAADQSQLTIFDKDLDYRVIRGGDQDQTQIVLTTASRIRSGATVYISYAAGQNFTVVYAYNKILEDVQTQVDDMKHATADVAVKQAVGNDIDISVRVTRKSGYAENDVINNITNNIAAIVQNMKLGTGFNLDDMVNIVKNTEGVRTLHLPPYRMMKANGSFIAGDLIGLVDFQVYTQNAGMGVTSYVSVDPVLEYGTQEGGGPSNLFRAIYEDGEPLVLAVSPAEVAQASGRGYIRGDGRIVVSTKDGMPPQTKEYMAAYYTYVPATEEFAADITVDSMEYLTIGVNSITVDASVEESVSRSFGK